MLVSRVETNSIGPFSIAIAPIAVTCAQSRERLLWLAGRQKQRRDTQRMRRVVKDCQLSELWLLGGRDGSAEAGGVLCNGRVTALGRGWGCGPSRART